jgi:hypothetical protein
VVEQGDDKGGDTATRDKQPGGCQSPVGKLTLLSKAPLSFLLVRVLFQLFVAALVGPRQWVGFTLRDNGNRGVQTNGEKHDPCRNEGCTDITISSLESHESFSALSRSFATIPTYSNWNDEGEHRAVMGEIGQVIHGAYGPLLKECSFVAEDGRLVGATLVTLSGAQVLLRHVVVDPSMKRRGIGSSLNTAGDNSLLAAGYRELDLVVTDTNETVVTLYIKLGVRVLERLREPPAAD